MIYSNSKKYETTSTTMASNTQQHQPRTYYSALQQDAQEYEGSVTPPTPDWMKADDESYGYSDESDHEEERQQPRGGFQSAPIPIPMTSTNVYYNPYDPLRYFLTNREITHDEYERWKIVHEVESPNEQRKKRIDFGPGHNSDSDSDDDDVPSTIYGDGYSVLLHNGVLIDSWNPNPDPTPDRRYTTLASDSNFLIRCLVDECGDTQPEPQSEPQLASAFLLKLTWERFAFCPNQSSHQRTVTMQHFWQENALVIYEAMQTLVDTHARVHKRTEKMSANMIPPPYSQTPIETLETTFETIGRMSRCIAEDFNTPSVADYIEEFIYALYREIVFNTLVETHLRKQPF